MMFLSAILTYQVRSIESVISPDSQTLRFNVKNRIGDDK